MFTDSDYAEYFAEIEKMLKELITVYTDLLNQLSDSSIKSKLSPLAEECMEAFRFAKEQRQNFEEKTGGER